MLRYLLMPVPAGMSLPMMTFSFRPISESLRAWIAASVNTRVGSWKGGGGQPGVGGQRRLGDPHEHRTAGGRLTTLGDQPAVLRLELRPVDQQPGQELGRATVDDGDPLEHLPDDDLDVLIVDLD